MKIKRVEKKEEKGSITLFVLIAMLFFVILGVAIFYAISNKQATQIQANQKNKEEYGKDLNQINSIYEETYEKTQNTLPVPPELEGKIPEGFYYVGGTKEEGLVISDIQGDNLDNAKGGNQFVWIPVDGTKVKYERQDFGKQSGSYSDYSETLDNTLKTSVETNKGFYIGRFEAGNSSNTARTSSDKTNITDKVVSKKNNSVYNFVTRDQAKELAEGMYPGKSKLVNSYAWDAVMNYVEDENHNIRTDSTSWGNYSNVAIKDDAGNEIKPIDTSKLLNAGVSKQTMQKNIYDLAGNTWEWTTEESDLADYPCVVRGGVFYDNGSNYPASRRAGGSASGSFSSYAFRVVLYL